MRGGWRIFLGHVSVLRANSGVTLTLRFFDAGLGMLRVHLDRTEINSIS